MDLHLKLNKEFYKHIDRITKRGEEYRSRIHKSKKHYESAKRLSATDLKERFNILKESPTPSEAIAIIRNLINSGFWISRSGYKVIQSSLDFTHKGDEQELSPKEISILKKVANYEAIEDVSDDEIFRCIFNELEYSHYFPEHKPYIRASSIDETIVLIPGVFNEIFSTPAFERSAKHLESTLNIKFFSPKVNGFKSSKHNAKLLEKQLSKYVRDNPEEKLWLVCFSKGGLDALNFLVHNNEFSKKYISGLSTIASPILGSDHLNHKLIKFLNGIHNFQDSKIYQALSSRNDLMAKEFQRSVSSTFQRPWLRRNYRNLPDHMFYTAIGFESTWYESHFWMMLTKLFVRSRSKNDGIVDSENSQFPYYFKSAINLGIHKGHHLIGTRSSHYCQEALIESLIVFLKYKSLLK